MFNIQQKLIEQIKEMLFEDNQVLSSIILGSFARKTAVENSDINIAILVSPDFDSSNLINRFQGRFSKEILKILKVESNNEINLYFKDYPKCEIIIKNEIEKLDKTYLLSEIKLENIEDSVLFDKSCKVLTHLENITKIRIKDQKETREKEIKSLINRFLYEFERCSAHHNRCDSYQFYFYYNIALHIAVQINHLAKGYFEFNFLPKNFSTDILPRDEQDHFFNLAGTLFLSIANQQKRKLLNFFYHSISTVLKEKEKNEIEAFCEFVYNRDILWNFRDISFYNPLIKKKKLYRTSSLTFIQNEPTFEYILSKINVRTVIDLRAEKEIAKSGYSENSLKLLNWVMTPLNHYTLSEEFKSKFQQKSAIEIEYCYFTTECKPAIKKAFENILKEENAIAIHCEAGKKRTGVFITFLHLLSNADKSIIYKDFLASEMDTKKEYLDNVLDIVDQHGGIEKYLLSCDIAANSINDIKQNILIGN